MPTRLHPLLPESSTAYLFPQLDCRIRRYVSSYDQAACVLDLVCQLYSMQGQCEADMYPVGLFRSHACTGNLEFFIHRGLKEGC